MKRKKFFFFKISISTKRRASVRRIMLRIDDTFTIERSMAMTIFCLHIARHDIDQELIMIDNYGVINYILHALPVKRDCIIYHSDVLY